MPAAAATSTISASRSAPEADLDAILARIGEIEHSIANVLCGVAEDDEFNQLVLYAALDTQAVVWIRAWFRYLRQTGSSFGLITIVDALRRAPNATRALIGLFVAAHDPAAKGRAAEIEKYGEQLDARSPRSARSTTTASCAACARWSRRSSAPTRSLRPPKKRSPSRSTAASFPACRGPCRGARSGSTARASRASTCAAARSPAAASAGRTAATISAPKSSGLMKAQLVKNAVIVPTGAKGGFYPKQLPPMSNRDAWLAEGTESYRIFIRSLLSVTDNLVNDKVVHPERVVIRDGDDPYFVVAADKGTATFSDIANEIALSRNFWLGDAFASGGSQRLRPQGDGDHRQGRVDFGAAPFPRNGRSTFSRTR